MRQKIELIIVANVQGAEDEESKIQVKGMMCWGVEEERSVVIQIGCQKTLRDKMRKQSGRNGMYQQTYRKFRNNKTKTGKKNNGFHA